MSAPPNDPVLDLSSWADELNRHGADTGPFISAYAAALEAHRQGHAAKVIAQAERLAAGLQQVAQQLEARRAMLERRERRAPGALT